MVCSGLSAMLICPFLSLLSLVWNSLMSGIHSWNYLGKFFSFFNAWLKYYPLLKFSLTISTHNDLSFMWISILLMIYWSVLTSYRFCVLLFQTDYKLSKQSSSLFLFVSYSLLNIMAHDKGSRNKKYLFFYLYGTASLYLNKISKSNINLFLIWRYQNNNIKASAIQCGLGGLSFFWHLHFYLTCLKRLWLFYHEVCSQAKQRL